MNKNSVVVRVPASASNLGSGFNTLGLALEIHTTLKVTRKNTRGIEIVSTIPEALWAPATVMLLEASKKFFSETRKASFGFEVSFSSDVPIGRGLGSSAALRVGLLAALDALSTAKLSSNAICEMAARLDGVPCSAAASVFGGFAVAGLTGDGFVSQNFPVSSKLGCIVLVPPDEIAERIPRRRVPESLAKEEALQCLKNAVLTTAAFAQDDLAALSGLVKAPYYHDAFRPSFIPDLNRVIAAAVRAGALGGFMSGSGGALVCLTLDHPSAVAAALIKSLPGSEVKILAVDKKGVVVR